MAHHSYLKILFIEDDLTELEIFWKMLDSQKDQTLKIVHATTLQDGIKVAQKEHPDVVLLDLSLPDSKGIHSINEFRATCPDIATIVLSDRNDQSLAIEAARHGIQDYLVKGEIHGDLFFRAIQYTIERNRVQRDLKQLALLDVLTGLYNRRGYDLLLKQQMSLSVREKKGFLLFIFDVNQFKKINDEHGHLEGDHALKEVANTLQKTFRSSDIVSRIGGDEFAVIALKSSTENIAGILVRMKTLFRKIETKKYSLSVEAGVAYFDPDKPVSQNKLFAEADSELMDKKNVRMQRR